MTELVALSDIGTTASAIKNYLAGMYNSSESLSFIILAGDADQIPTIQASSPSDASYALLEGDDHYADAFVSRIAAQSAADVQTQLSKFINYGQNPQIGAAWYSRGVGIASSESGGTGLTDYERADLLRDMLLNYNYTAVDQVYDPGATTSQAFTSVNAGCSIINYIGHGSGTSWVTTGFNISDVNLLDNGQKLPYILDVSCSNGAFTGSDDCFAEAWLKAGSVTAPKGAIAMFSSSTTTAWVPPCVMQHEAVELITTEQKHTFGGIAFHGIYAALDQYPGSDGIDLMEQYNLFGDCSMQIRTATPGALSVVHDSIILIGSQTVDISVTGTDEACVALTKNETIYARGMIPAGTQVSLPLQTAITALAEFTLTVNAYNCVPYKTTLAAIAPQGPRLAFEGYTIHDTEQGNGN